MDETLSPKAGGSETMRTHAVWLHHWIGGAVVAGLACGAISPDVGAALSPSHMRAEVTAACGAEEQINYAPQCIKRTDTLALVNVVGLNGPGDEHLSDAEVGTVGRQIAQDIAVATDGAVKLTLEVIDAPPAVADEVETQSRRLDLGSCE